MTITAVTFDPAAMVMTIDSTIPADTPDEASVYELRPAEPGGFSKVWHTAASKQNVRIPGVPRAFSLHHRVVGAEGREVWTVAADGSTAAATAADGEGRGLLYDHTAIDHGPDGPVEDGDANVPPNPATDAVVTVEPTGNGDNGGVNPMSMPGDYYTVKAGDTLTSIADAWNTSVNSVATYNSITDPNVINVGDLLVRPGAPVPTSANTVAEIKAWLDAEGIDRTGVTGKSDLLALVP